MLPFISSFKETIAVSFLRIDKDPSPVLSLTADANNLNILYSG